MPATTRSTSLGNVRQVSALLACSMSAACGFDDGMPTGSGGSRDWTPVSTATRPVERDNATPAGEKRTTWPRERTILGRDGSVTVVQRDRDGTRTIVGSHGVRVIPPDTSYRRRR